MRFRLTLIVLSAILVASCVTVPGNYLSETKPDSPASYSGKQPMEPLNDSVVHKILSGKDQNAYFSAKEMNTIHRYFGQRLHLDRLLAARLTEQPDQAYEAAIRLLSSAAWYEQLFSQNRIIRQSLNRGDTGNDIPGNTLQKSRNFLFSPSVRKEILRLRQRAPSRQGDSLLARIPATTHWLALKNRIGALASLLQEAGYSLMEKGSRLFGMTVGKIEGENSAARNAVLLAPLLQPLDIILMKAPQRLTDNLIPGYFGHMAICLGSDSLFLREVAPDRNLSQYHALFPRTAMIEAVRKDGVRISTLEDFAEGQVFLLLRPSGLSPEQKKRIVDNALKQLHKKYDFQFNVNSLDKITCTELIFTAFEDVDWEVEKIAGRYTLSPDAIVRSAQHTGLFGVPAILHKGTITEGPSWSDITALMDEP